MFFHTDNPGSASRRSVSDDWITALPREKSNTFEALVAEWESMYAMMSVALDDSLTLRSRGELVCARQQVIVTSQLFDRISSLLISFCDAAARYSRHLRRFPAVEPLNTNFFRGNIGQQAASWNGLVHRILFGDRSRFHHKLKILSDTLRRLEQEFRRAAATISGGASAEPVECWKVLDCIHYDFSTCLRENEVLLKSFLRVLPSQHVADFSRDMGVPAPAGGVATGTRLSGASA